MSPNQRQTFGPAAFFWSVLIAVCHTAPAAATEPNPHHVFDDGVGVYFLDKSDGAKAIVEDGPNGFFDRLTLLEMALRLGRDLDSNDVEAQRTRFKKFVSRNVREWTQAEKEELLATVKSAHGMCKDSLPELLPDAWRFIKTSGDAEGAPHTRGSAVVLPVAMLAAGVSEHVLIHELFHLYSRVHPAKRLALYKTLGFRALPPVVVPPGLQRKRITNPDGADINFAITVTARGRKVDVVPIVYSRFDQRRSDLKSLFAYVTFGLFEVREANGEWSVVVDERGEPLAPLPPTVDGFFQQIGRNTQYIIHPDEILADNVALLVTASADKTAGRIATPDLLDRIKQVIQAGEP